jgi:glycine/D-amino acid oxidase-like deaminating enzyme
VPAGPRPVDVAIAGSGVTGLLMARAVRRLGYSAVVVEQAELVSAGSTARNEGWLHHGTYHAVSVEERRVAIAVARQCIYGSRRLQQIAPEAVEQPLAPAFAFTALRERVGEIESRWAEAGVRFERISRQRLASAVPQLRTADLARCYEVQDRAVDTAALASILAGDCERLGAAIHRPAEILGYRDRVLAFRHRGRTVRYRPGVLVVACGAGTAKLCETLELSPPTVFRFWRSHIVAAPRFVSATAISLDPGDISSINHGQATVVGLNDDARRVPGECHDTDPSEERRLVDTLARRVRTPLPAAARVMACTKIDAQPDADGQPVRSVAPVAVRLGPAVLAVLPGKMSEAPYLVDRVALLIRGALGSTTATPRQYEDFATGTGTRPEPDAEGPFRPADLTGL